MFFDIPNKDGVWVYNTGSATWFTWVKPPQYNNFIFYVCGGGGGGAGVGFNATAGGGGGGGGGTLATLNAPSFLLPESIYIQIGKGGAGGNVGVPGSNGGVTYLGYYPNTNAANLIISSNGGSGGTQGASTNGGAGGAGGTAYSSQSIFSYTSIPGGAGTTGGFNSDGISYTSTVSCIYGGTGGGAVGSGIAYNGGSIIGSNIHPTFSNSAGQDGFTGVLIKKPFTSIGGGGGAGGIGATGKKGGIGSWGSGGGGGGASTASPPSGTGGAGGDGFVIIIGY